MLVFVSSAALLLVMAAAAFCVLLALKQPLNMSSSTFQLTLLAMVVYQAIAVFSSSLGRWRKVAGFVVAATTYILVFAVTKYALVEVYAQNLTETFWGISIADDIAFLAGGIVQLVLIYRWRSRAQASLATPSSPSCFLLFLKAGLHRTVAGIKAFTPFQGVVIVLLLLNALLSYGAWDAADEAVWQAADAGQEAQSAAHLASDAVDAADKAYNSALLCR